MALDLENLDATILQFEPDFKIETIKPNAFRPPKDWSNWGEMTRIACPSYGKRPNRLRAVTPPLSLRYSSLQLDSGFMHSRQT